MKRSNVYPHHGLFTLNGRYIGPFDIGKETLLAVWKTGGLLVDRPIVYSCGLTKLCGGCRGRRNRTHFDPKPASRKERLITCDKCGRVIAQNDTNIAMSAAHDSGAADCKQTAS